MQTIRKYYRVDRRQIAFMRFIFEAYDGLAVIRTVDAAAGIVSLHIAPGCEKDVAEILRELQNDIILEDVAPPDGADAAQNPRPPREQHGGNE